MARRNKDRQCVNRFCGQAAPLVIMFAAVIVLSGCAQRWVMDAPETTALQWPRTEEPRIREVMTLVGFKQKGESFSSSVRKIVFGSGSENGFVLPVAIATASDGRMAVADQGSKAVHLFLPSEGLYFKISSAVKEQLDSPVSVAFDENLRLYVSDSGLRKILIYNRQGKYEAAITGANGKELKRPTGLAYNPEKKLLYVIDTLEHRVYAFNTASEEAFSFGGRGVEEGSFNFPTHIFWSAGKVYIVDSMNFRVQVFDDAGSFVASFGRHGDGSGDFAMPKGVAVDKDGTVYIADSLFDNVQLFDNSGKFLLSITDAGNQGDFRLPSGIFIDVNQRLYVCDTYNQRIRIFQIIRSGMKS